LKYNKYRGSTRGGEKGWLLPGMLAQLRGVHEPPIYDLIFITNRWSFS